MYDPFQKHKKSPFVFLFWIKWLDVQATLMQVIKHIVYIIET